VDFFSFLFVFFFTFPIFSWGWAGRVGGWSGWVGVGVERSGLAVRGKDEVSWWFQGEGNT
jgi:hypothetical protein